MLYILEEIWLFRQINDFLTYFLKYVCIAITTINITIIIIRNAHGFLNIIHKSLLGENNTILL